MKKFKSLVCLLLTATVLHGSLRLCRVGIH